MNFIKSNVLLNFKCKEMPFVKTFPVKKNAQTPFIKAQVNQSSTKTKPFSLYKILMHVNYSN